MDIFWPCKKKSGIRDGFINGKHVVQVSKIGGTGGTWWETFCLLCDEDFSAPLMQFKKGQAKKACQKHIDSCPNIEKVKDVAA